MSDMLGTGESAGICHHVRGAHWADKIGCGAAELVGGIGPRETYSSVAGTYAEDQQPAAGKKFDSGKSPMAQAVLAYFGKALEGVGLISAYGAQKYGVGYVDQNWRKVENAKGRYADALLRHLKAHLQGELIDAESGKPHIDMVSWNALALSELEKA